MVSSRGLPSALGPRCVGLRVVVRHRVPGETGPSGGPRMTDVLGVMEDWSGAATTVRREDGERVRIALADIVAGKPVPPKPSVRLRESAAEVSRRAVADWPPEEIEPLGEWLLRAAGGWSRRANSALAVGDPGVPVAEAVERVSGFYTDRGLPPTVAAFAGTGLDEELVARGWQAASDDILVQVAGVAGCLRALDETDVPEDEVDLGGFDDAWWEASPDRPLDEHGRRILTGGEEVVFARVVRDGALVARGRGALTVRHDVRLGLAGLWTHSEHRRDGLGNAVLRALLEWAAEAGATSTYLQVAAVNEAALGAYEQLGFLTHHTYRYLRSPGSHERARPPRGRTGPER